MLGKAATAPFACTTPAESACPAPGHVPDAPDYDGRTPAHLAALEGHEKVLDALLANGADPSLLDRCRGPPQPLPRTP